MPLTLALTEGVLPVGTEKEAVAQLSAAMLKRHGLRGIKVMTTNITATVLVLPKNSTFSREEELSGAWIEWKVPSFAFVSREVQHRVMSEMLMTSFMTCLAENKLKTTTI